MNDRRLALSRGTAVAVVLAVLVLLVPGAGSASGINPVPPNPGSLDAQRALHATLSGANAYSETFTFGQSGSPVSTACGAGCFAIGGTYENVSNASLVLPPSALLVSSSVTVSVTKGCPSVCPPFILNCDGIGLGAVATAARPCQRADVDFVGNHVSSIPTVSVTRVQEWTITQPQGWVGTSTGGATSSSVTIWPASTVGTPSATKLTSWTVNQISWAVPLPAGTWIASGTTVQFLNTSTYLTHSQFSNQPTWILIQWTSLPSSQCLECTPPISHQQVLLFFFNIESSNPIHGGGGILPPSPGGTNTTAPSVPNPVTFNRAVSLTAANITTLGQGNYSARLFWYNSYAVPVVGPFYIVSALLKGSSNISITANGIPIPSSGIGISTTSVQLYPGQVVVPNGTSLQLLVTFHYNASFNPRAIFGYINGVPITAGVVVGLGAFGLAGLLALAEFNSPIVARSRVTGAAEGTVMLAALVIVWMGAM